MLLVIFTVEQNISLLARVTFQGETYGTQAVEKLTRELAPQVLNVSIELSDDDKSLFLLSVSAGGRK